MEPVHFVNNTAYFKVLLPDMHQNLQSAMQAYTAGLTFALAASPCSTPVLATLLAYVSTTQKPIEGAGLLLAYTTG